MNKLCGKGIGLWDEQDEFYYDVLHTPGGRNLPLRVRSLVGLMPLLAVETVQWQLIEALPGFKSRLEWYLQYRPDLASLVSRWQEPGMKELRLVALTRGHRMKCLLRRMLDPNEFLSDYGVRSLSKLHQAHPYSITIRGEEKIVSYEPAESQTGIFGGNSNWRGPVWFPINYLLIESLQQFHHYYGDDFKVECPTGSGRHMNLYQVAEEVAGRLHSIFLKDKFDLTILTTAAWSDFSLAAQITRREGTISVVGFPGRGLPNPPDNPLDSQYFYDSQLRLVYAGLGPQADAPLWESRFSTKRNCEYLLDRITEQRLDAAALFGTAVSFERLEDCYIEFGARQPSTPPTFVLNWASGL